MSGEAREASRPRDGRVTALVDGHVHVHPGFDEVVFFRGAHRHLSDAADHLNISVPWRGMLVLTEGEGRNYFSELCDRVGQGERGQLRVEETGETSSLRVSFAPVGGEVTVVAGRQIQTAERLEVLGFPLRDPVPDGLPIESVVSSLGDRGVVAVIPWGLGKWRYSRGRVLRRLVLGPGEKTFFLADTGHRPAWMSVPSLLRRAEEAGAATLTGSDPLPLWGEVSRAGSCCFEIQIDLSAAGPAEGLRRAVIGLRRAPRRFERRPGLAAFAWKQLAMQARRFRP